MPGRGRHARVRRRDRPPLPLPPHALAPARDGALRAQAPGAAAGAVSDEKDAVQPRGGGLERGAVRRPGRVPRAPRRLVVELGPPPRAGRRGARPRLRRRRPRRAPARRRAPLPRRRRHAGDGRRGGAAPRRAARVELGDLNTYEPPGDVAATTLFRAIYYARRPAPRSSTVSRASRRRSSSSTSTRASTRSRTSARARRRRVRRASSCARSSSRRRARCRGLPPRLSVRPSARARSPASLLRHRFTYVVRRLALRRRTVVEAERDLGAELRRSLAARVDLVRHERVRRSTSTPPRHRGAGSSTRLRLGVARAHADELLVRHLADVRLLVGADRDRPDLDEDARRDRRGRAERRRERSIRRVARPVASRP